MNDSIARAKFIDKLMTAVFYCVAGFFTIGSEFVFLGGFGWLME